MSLNMTCAWAQIDRIVQQVIPLKWPVGGTTCSGKVNIILLLEPRGKKSTRHNKFTPIQLQACNICNQIQYTTAIQVRARRLSDPATRLTAVFLAAAIHGWGWLPIGSFHGTLHVGPFFWNVCRPFLVTFVQKNQRVLDLLVTFRFPNRASRNERTNIRAQSSLNLAASSGAATAIMHAWIDVQTIF